MKFISLSSKKKSAVNTVISVAFFFMVLLLASCKNFLKSTEIKKEIEESIAFANAESCNLVFKADESMGVFLVDSSKGFKLGHSTKIQFSVNKDYYVFKTLEAVSLIDNNVSRSDYVEFTVDKKESNVENGIYTIYVKVLSITNDILIRPVCIPYPVITSYSPASVADAHFANEPIQITFNIPMEAEDVSKEDSIFNFKTNNIQLTYNGNSVIQYFENPVFNKEKTILTIAPKGPELKTIIKTSYIDVQVSIKDNLNIVQDDVQLPFKQNEMSSFTVRYKPEIEEVKPKIDSLFVTRNEYSIEEARNLSSDYKFSEGGIDKYDSNKVNKNKTRDTIYIYGSCYDADSGVKEIAVIEQRKKDSKDETVTEYAKKAVPYTQDNSVFETKDGTTEFCIEHKLQAADGLIQLTVICYDACNNFVEYTGEINVVKKSSIQFYSGDISIGNHPGIEINSEESIEQFNSNLNKLRVNAGRSGGAFGHSGYADCVIYGNVCTDPALLTLNLKYTDKDNILHDEDFEYYDVTDPDDSYQQNPIGWTLELKNFGNVSGKQLFLTITDDLGNSYGKTFTFLTEPSLIFGRKQYKQGSSNYYGTFASYVFDSGVLTKQVSLIEKNTTNNAITEQYVTQSDTNSYDVLIPSSCCEYRLMFANNGLYSPIGTQTFKQSDYNSTGLETIYLETDGYPKVEKSSKDGYLDITVKLYETQSENLWDSYDSFFIEYAGETIANFEPQSQTCKFQLNTYNCFRFNQPFTVYGVKDKSFNYYSATLPKVTDVSKDNAPPRFYRDPALWQLVDGFDYKDHHNCEIKVWDRESGISKVYVITKDNKEILLYNNPVGFKNDPDDGYFTNSSLLCVKIPLSYIMSNHVMINGNAYVNIGVEDAQGNKTQEYAISEVLDPIWTEIKLNSGLYDLMIPNGNSKTSFAISSDAPVYVYTLHLRKDTDYSSWILKDWEDHMEHYGYDPSVEECGFTYLDFSDSDYTPKRYNVPADVVETGDPYCVVVHFFDGSVLTSGVIN